MIGENIKRIREYKGISQQDLAAAIDVSNGYLNRLENGKKTNPTIDVITNIAKVLDCDVIELIKDDIERKDTQKNNDISLEVKSIKQKIKKNVNGPVLFNGKKISKKEAELMLSTLGILFEDEEKEEK